MATRKKSAEAAPEVVSETPEVETPQEQTKEVPHGAIQLPQGLLLYKMHGDRTK